MTGERSDPGHDLHSPEWNGHRTKDTMKLLDADGKTVNSVLTYEYDPMDRLVKYTKTGDNATNESYKLDANHNIIEQRINGTTTTYNYDRNRLFSATTSGVTVKYNYDPFGRLDTVTAAGMRIEKYKYDGFDRIAEHHKLEDGTSTTKTKYTYDPLDRTVSQTEKAGTSKEKTTQFNYLGLGSEVLSEEVADKITKSYQYSPWGERLSMVKHNDDGSKEDSFYGYNTRTDVEVLTDEDGNICATYGYTAYGSTDEKAFTGVDKPDPVNPDKEVYNVYRYSAKRWDPATKNYDMGFRDYSPGLNRFLTLDMYNGALADMGLTTDPWTGNRYAFTAGNPISNVELDGHCFAIAAPLLPICVKEALEVGVFAALVYAGSQALSNSDTSGGYDYGGGALGNIGPSLREVSKAVNAGPAITAATATAIQNRNNEKLV